MICVFSICVVQQQRRERKKKQTQAIIASFKYFFSILKWKIEDKKRCTRKHREKIYCVESTLWTVGQFFRNFIATVMWEFTWKWKITLSLYLFLCDCWITKHTQFVVYPKTEWEWGKKKSPRNEFISCFCEKRENNIKMKSLQTNGRFFFCIVRTIPIYFVVIVRGAFASPINQWS